MSSLFACVGTSSSCRRRQEVCEFRAREADCDGIASGGSNVSCASRAINEQRKRTGCSDG